MSAELETPDVLRLLWHDGPHSLNYKPPGGRFGTVGMFDDPAELHAKARSLVGDAWWGVNATPGAARRGEAADVTEASVLYCDLDWADEALKGEGLPTEAEVRAVVEAFALTPTVVIATGGGLHLYWRLSEPVPVETWSRGQALVRAALEAKGLHVEATDAARVLRVPGTMNHKVEPPRAVVVEQVRHHDDRRLTVEMFEDRWGELLVERERVERTEAASLLDQLDRAGGGPISDYNASHPIADELEASGWTPNRHGEHWSRPGVDDHQSAKVHADDDGREVLMIYSDSPELERLRSLGKPCDGNRSIVMASAFDLFADREHDGDTEAATQALRRRVEWDVVEVPDEPGEGEEGPETMLLVDWAAVSEDEARQYADGTLVAGRWTQFIAKAKQGKSTVALWMAVELSEGRDPWTGEPVEPVTVLYVDAEMGELDIEEKLADFGIDPFDLDRCHFSTTPVQLDHPKGAAVLLNTVAKLRPDVVVLDGLNGQVGGEENDDGTWRDLYKLVVHPLKARRIAVLSSDNMGKDTSKGARGSSVKEDKADAVFAVAKLEGGVQLKRRVTRSRVFAESVSLAADVIPGGGVEALRSTTGKPGWPEGTKDAVTLLDELGVPVGLGRPTVRRDYLKSLGVRGEVRNNVLAAAIRFRSERADREWEASVLEGSETGRGQLGDSSRPPNVGQPRGQHPENPSDQGGDSSGTGGDSDAEPCPRSAAVYVGDSGRGGLETEVDETPSDGRCPRCRKRPLSAAGRCMDMACGYEEGDAV